MVWDFDPVLWTLPYCFQTLGGSGSFCQRLIRWVLLLLAVPWSTTSQEAFGDTAGVAGQPPPGQDSVQCHPRPSQQQNAGKSPVLAMASVNPAIFLHLACLLRLLWPRTQSLQKGRVNLFTCGVSLALLLVLGSHSTGPISLHGDSPSPCRDKPVWRSLMFLSREAHVPR